MSDMDEEKLQKSLLAHEDRNAALRKVFLKRNIDMRAARDIDLHFLAWGQANAIALAESLGRSGLQVPVRRPAIEQDGQDLWNVEAYVKQSIDLTMRPDLITDLIKLADSHGGVFDGWGTLL
jgi:putative heme degradation protein